jgi:hypothetical protein
LYILFLFNCSFYNVLVCFHRLVKMLVGKRTSWSTSPDGLVLEKFNFEPCTVFGPLSIFDRTFAIFSPRAHLLLISFILIYNVISFVTRNLIGSFGFTNILHIVWNTFSIYSHYMTSNAQRHNTFDCNVSLYCYGNIDLQYVKVINCIEIINQMMSKIIY